MASTKTVTIGYAGTLSGYTPVKNTKGIIPVVRRYFWTYNHNHVNSNTRSGYYLINAVKKLKERFPLDAERLSIQLWGNIDPINSHQISELGVEDILNVEGFISKEDSIKKMADCDMLLLPLEMSNLGNETLFIPGKLFDLLKIGKPILALAEQSDCRRIIERANLGVFAKPNDPDDIARVLKYSIHNIDHIRNSRKPNMEYISEFSSTNITRQFVTIFNSIR